MVVRWHHGTHNFEWSLAFLVFATKSIRNWGRAMVESMEAFQTASEMREIFPVVGGRHFASPFDYGALIFEWKRAV